MNRCTGKMDQVRKYTPIYPGGINCSHTQIRKYSTSNLPLIPQANHPDLSLSVLLTTTKADVSNPFVYKTTDTPIAKCIHSPRIFWIGPDFKICHLHLLDWYLPICPPSKMPKKKVDWACVSTVEICLFLQIVLQRISTEVKVIYQ